MHADTTADMNDSDEHCETLHCEEKSNECCRVERRALPFLTSSSVSAYQGSAHSVAVENIEEALQLFEDFIDIEEFTSSEELVEDAVREITSGGVLGWFQGRSEVGQRALGARSILADPRNRETRVFINKHIKQREWFRPLAPAALDELAGDWFEDLENHANASPFMSVTTKLKREKISSAPAVSHIDQSARLQTVSLSHARESRSETLELFHRLIRRFYELTQVPMLLNTSLNGPKQPIIETVAEAVQFLLRCRGALTALYVNQKKITLKRFPLQAVEVDGDVEVEVGPNEHERKLVVRAQQLYLSEVTYNSKTTGVSAGNNAVLKVRIQDSLSVEKENAEENWRELPSELHLDLLQLLQPTPTNNNNNDNDDNDNIDIDNNDDDNHGDLLLSDLWDALLQIRTPVHHHHHHEHDNNDCSDDCAADLQEKHQLWRETKQALEYLYYEGLVSFYTSEEAETASLEELKSTLEKNSKNRLIDLRAEE